MVPPRRKDTATFLSVWMPGITPLMLLERLQRFCDDRLTIQPHRNGIREDLDVLVECSFDLRDPQSMLGTLVEAGIPQEGVSIQFGTQLQ